MWKTVIADDEPKIRQGIKETIENFGLDIEVVGEAKNGLQALELVGEIRPDILFADISMPKLNGISLIEMIQQTGVDCKVIIVTGYDKFDYARQAVHLGVSYYILKPIVESELKKALELVIEELQDERRETKLQTLMSRQLEKNRKYLTKNFFNEWIRGNLTDEERREEMSILAVELPADPLMLFVCAPYSVQMYTGDTALSEKLARYTVEKTLEELLQKYEPVYVFTDRFQNTVALIDCCGKASVEIMMRCRSEMERMMGVKCEIAAERCTERDFVEKYDAIRNRLQRESEYRPVIKDAQKYIMRSYMESELDLTSVAEAIGSSPSYLSRLMKQQLGMSFKDFLTTLRIQKACGLMKDKTISISEVSELVGYSNQHYFSTAFKNAMGMTPSEYKKSLENGDD